jgi:hypothetical protein
MTEQVSEKQLPLKEIGPLNRQVAQTENRTQGPSPRDQSRENRSRLDRILQATRVGMWD